MSIGIVFSHTEVICARTAIAGYIHLFCVLLHFYTCILHLYAPFQYGAVCTSGSECMCLVYVCVYVSAFMCVLVSIFMQRIELQMSLQHKWLPASGCALFKELWNLYVAIE